MSRIFDEPGRIPKEKIKRKIYQNTWREDLAETFKENLNIIKSLRKAEEDNKEILRVQIAFLMSLYDYTIHEIIKYKMVDIYTGNQEETKAYKLFKVSINTLKVAVLNPEEPLKWLPQELEFQNDKISYINPIKTLEALEIITDINIFEEYCKEKKLNYNIFLNELRYLVSRRNKIVHGMDIKDKRTLVRNEITIDEVDKGIYRVEDTVLYIINKI